MSATESKGKVTMEMVRSWSQRVCPWVPQEVKERSQMLKVKLQRAKGKGKGHNKMIKKKEQRINYNLVNEVHSVYYFYICL